MSNPFTATNVPSLLVVSPPPLSPKRPGGKVQRVLHFLTNSPNKVERKETPKVGKKDERKLTPQLKRSIAAGREQTCQITHLWLILISHLLILFGHLTVRTPN